MSSTISLSVHLPRDLHLRAKEAAADQHVSLGAVVRQAIQHHLGGCPVGADPLVKLAEVSEAIVRVERALDRALAQAVRLEDRLRAFPPDSTVGLARMPEP